MSAFPKWRKIPKLLVALAVSLPVLLGVGWVASYLQSVRAGEHLLGHRYEGSLKYIDKRRMGGGRYGVNRKHVIHLAIVETKDKREIIVHDPAELFVGCESGDNISYRMEESAVRGVDFIYINGSCREP